MAQLSALLWLGIFIVYVAFCMSEHKDHAPLKWWHYPGIAAAYIGFFLIAGLATYVLIYPIISLLRLF